MSDEYRRRACLALSILDNAERLGTEQALAEARLALEGASILDIAELRDVQSCHGTLAPGAYCATCGTYNAESEVA